MLIRPLTTVEECRTVAELEKVVWGYTTADDVVPPPLLTASIRRGGVLLGAFDEAGAMKGFAYAMPAMKDGQPTLWSHMMGVASDARGSGLGLALKLAQRQYALRMGIELIEWTCDPLQALNAHIGFAKLGIVSEEYEENLYGESDSPLHRGTPTDRFVAQWHLSTPHVERRIAAAGRSGRGVRGPMGVRDSAVMAAVLVNPSISAGAWLGPGKADMDVEAARLLVEIPCGFSDLLNREPRLALDWRLATRQIFQTYFARGYRAVDFFLGRDEGRGQYLLARAGA
jgi:predicted GNAT superfamily acetyltransferase